LRADARRLLGLVGASRWLATEQSWSILWGTVGLLAAGPAEASPTWLKRATQAAVQYPREPGVAWIRCTGLLDVAKRGLR